MVESPRDSYGAQFALPGPFDSIDAIKAANAAAGKHFFEASPRLAADLDDVAHQLRAALDCLDNLTTAEFAHGGDRPARWAIVAALYLLGEATADEVAEYGVDRA